MNTGITKKTILYSLISLWVFFSIVYIANDIWLNYRNVQMVRAYEQGKEQGRAETITSLLREAEKCEPVPIFIGEKETRLIEIGCPGVNLGQ
jgi:hypothetical protein